MVLALPCGHSVVSGLRITQKLYSYYKTNSSHKTVFETPKSPALKFSSVNSSPRQHTCQKPREMKYCYDRSEKPLESQTPVEGSQFPEKCLLQPSLRCITVRLHYSAVYKDTFLLKHSIFQHFKQ